MSNVTIEEFKEEYLDELTDIYNYYVINNNGNVACAAYDTG